MDPTERCTHCDNLFDAIQRTFKQFRVDRPPATWTKDYCVGFLSIPWNSCLHPIDILSLNYTVQFTHAEERFRLIAFMVTGHEKCLGILHDRQFLETATDTKTKTPSLDRNKWQKGEPRISRYDNDALEEITRKASNDTFVYKAVPGSNLGTVTCHNPQAHAMLDISAWIHELASLDRYPIRGIWCYINTRVSDHSFSLEVVTGPEPLPKKPCISKTNFSHKRRVFQFCLTIALPLVASFLWNRLSTMPFWKGW